MPANVESLFYVSNEANERFVPWHGLGTAVENTPTSKEAIRLAGLDWEVEGKPIFDSEGKQIKGYVANTRSTDNSVLGIVTNKYKVVQNSEAFEFTDSLLEENVTYETAGSLKNGKTIWLLAKMPEQKILDDAFDPYVCFMNTHDGTGAIKVCMTPIRVVCNNTLNLALSQAKRMWSTKHMGDMQSKLAEAKHTLALANHYMDELNNEAQRLVDIKVTDSRLEEIINELYPVNENEDTERKLVNIQTMKENLYRCYNMPDISKFKGTAWGLINAVTDFTDHTAPTRLTENYQENNWGRILKGHTLVDKFYERLVG